MARHRLHRACVEVVDEARLRELTARDVDRDRRSDPARLPRLHLTACLLDDPLANLDDEPAVLRERNEAVRREQAACRVVPADQRFAVEHGAGRERDDRLVEEHELAAIDRDAQVRLDLPAVHRRDVQLVGEDGVAAATAALRAVECRVRIAEDVLRGVVAREPEGDADAERRVEGVAGGVDRLGDRSEQALGDAHRVGVAGEPFEQDNELVAAEADDVAFGDRDGVGRPNARREAARERDEERVTDEVAEAVVDDLEAIEIDEEHGVAKRRMPLLPREAAREPLDEQRTFRKARQHVVRGVVPELDLRHPSMRDVRLRASRAERHTVVGSAHRATAKHPAVLAVGVEDAALDRDLLLGPVLQ